MDGVTKGRLIRSDVGRKTLFPATLKRSISGLTSVRKIVFAGCARLACLERVCVVIQDLFHHCYCTDYGFFIVSLGDIAWLYHMCLCHAGRVLRKYCLGTEKGFQC